MKLKKTLAILIVGLAVFACGPRVTTSKTTSKDLSNYNTFAYLPNSSVEMPDKAFNDDVNSAIVETVNNNMRKAGYTLDRNNPDLLVLISTKTNLKTETTTDPVYATYPYMGGVATVSPFYDPYYYSGYANYTNIVGYDTDTYAYKEGTLIINLVDRETKETVWKGISSKSLYDQTNTAAIQDLVNQIFQEYPLNQ
ncbi:MAG: DUF4136 domain-containing protein [Salegentibacter sp.]